MMSSNALAVVQRYEDEQLLQTIRDTVCKGATPAQFRMFIEVCKSTGLNPFLKEIYYVAEKGIIMAARDGYLRVANENLQFDGMETLVERDDKKVPIKATCRVWRKDRAHPVTCEAYYSEYKKSSPVWTQYPSAMISKVAEVLALKRSFAINGVVTEEEVGEQGSKEAQQEYLRSKGIEPKPHNPETRADVRNASEAHKALIVETAKMLDDPPQSQRDVVAEVDRITKIFVDAPTVKTIEMRTAAQVAEATEVLKSKPRAKAKTGAVSFEVLKHFGLIKEEMRESSGDDGAYYAVLKSFGYGKSNELADNDKAREIYKAMGVERNRLKQEKELRALLEHSSEVLGAKTFLDILGLDYGCENIDAVLQLDSERLQGLLTYLKHEVDERRSKS